MARVTLVALSSVTHSFNMSQRFNELPFTREGTDGLRAQLPNLNNCPVGYYLLHVLNASGVPSTGRFFQVTR